MNSAVIAVLDKKGRTRMSTTFEGRRAQRLKSEKQMRPRPAQRANAARKLTQAHNDALLSNPRSKEVLKPGQGFVLVGAKRSTLDT
jgi:hypothetical protein